MMLMALMTTLIIIVIIIITLVTMILWWFSNSCSMKRSNFDWMWYCLILFWKHGHYYTLWLYKDDDGDDGDAENDDGDDDELDWLNSAKAECLLGNVSSNIMLFLMQRKNIFSVHSSLIKTLRYATRKKRGGNK